MFFPNRLLLVVCGTSIICVSWLSAQENSKQLSPKDELSVEQDRQLSPTPPIVLNATCDCKKVTVRWKKHPLEEVVAYGVYVIPETPFERSFREPYRLGATEQVKFVDRSLGSHDAEHHPFQYIVTAITWYNTEGFFSKAIPIFHSCKKRHWYFCGFASHLDSEPPREARFFFALMPCPTAERIAHRRAVYQHVVSATARCEKREVEGCSQ